MGGGGSSFVSRNAYSYTLLEYSPSLISGQCSGGGNAETLTTAHEVDHSCAVAVGVCKM